MTSRLRFVEVLRAQGGSPGSLAAGRAGTVVAASGRGLQDLGSSGTPHSVPDFWPRVHAPPRLPFDPAFGDGVTVGTQGQIYVDTDAGDSIPNQGLLEVFPSGRVVWLWEEPG